MKLKDFLLLELKDYVKGTNSFWIDDIGNLLFDIKDDEDVVKYVDRKADKINKENGNKLKDKFKDRDVKTFDINNIIDFLKWSHVTLLGRPEVHIIHDLKNKGQNKEIKNNIYTSAVIRISGKMDDKKKNSEPLVKDIINKLQSIYPSLKKIRVIDKEYCVKELPLEEPKKPKKFKALKYKKIF